MRDLFTIAPGCNQLLFHTVFIIRNDRVGCLQYFFGRAIVLIEDDGFRRRKITSVVHDDIDICPTPCVDGLIRITDNIQACILITEIADQTILQSVDILKLIHKNEFKSFLPLFTNRWKVFEDADCKQNQIIKVQRIHLFLPFCIILIYLCLIFIISKLIRHLKSS